MTRIINLCTNSVPMEHLWVPPGSWDFAANTFTNGSYSDVIFYQSILPPFYATQSVPHSDSWSYLIYGFGLGVSIAIAIWTLRFLRRTPTLSMS